MGQEKPQRLKYIGTFHFPNGTSAVGELLLHAADTLLEAHIPNAQALSESLPCLKGTTYSGRCLSLIDCSNSESSSSPPSIGSHPQYTLKVFPRYVAVGPVHLDPLQNCIRRIQFSTTDLTTLFHDPDAFGMIGDARPIIDSVLKTRWHSRPVIAGAHPLVAYFAGRYLIADVSTAIGRIRVFHELDHNTGDPSGVYIRNRCTVTIEPDLPLDFEQAMDTANTMATFLSVAAGRSQGMSDLRFAFPFNTPHEAGQRIFHIYPSFPWKVRGSDGRYKPNECDIPLDPVGRSEEFNTVLTHWTARHDRWRTARHRYITSLRKADLYGPDRLIAAANMFDLLPNEAVPTAKALTGELAQTRDACLEMFRELPSSQERNAAISALTHLGSTSLSRKILHRAAIVESTCGRFFPDLSYVGNLAARCRNIFVHGRSGNLKPEIINPFVPFLTDTLEFIFAASDFIEAGWDGLRWASGSHGWGHSFSRLSRDYSAKLQSLRKAVKT